MKFWHFSAFLFLVVVAVTRPAPAQTPADMRAIVESLLPAEPDTFYFSAEFAPGRAILTPAIKAELDSLQGGYAHVIAKFDSLKWKWVERLDVSLERKRILNDSCNVAIATQRAVVAAQHLIAERGFDPRKVTTGIIYAEMPSRSLEVIVEQEKLTQRQLLERAFEFAHWLFGRVPSRVDTIYSVREDTIAVEETKRTEVSLDLYGNDKQAIGGALQLQFPSGNFLGASADGQDWNDKFEFGGDVFVGRRVRQLPFIGKVPLSVLGGFRYETNLDGYWDRYGGFAALQYTPSLKFLKFYFQSGVKLMYLYRTEVRGPLRFYSDPADPYLIHVKEPVLVPALQKWEEPRFYIRGGLRINLN